MDEQIQKDLESFTIRPYRSKRLKPYYSQYGKDNLNVLVDDNVKDMLLAQGYSIPDAPRSIYRVEKLFEALSGYAPNKIPKTPVTDNVRSGISLAYACFARKADQPYLHVLPFNPATIAYITSNPTGSPGLTNYGCSKAESVTRALERGLQTLRKEKQPEPCLAFKRTQFNDKTRLVWGYPYSMTCIEGLVAKPLIEKFKGGTTPMAFAMTTGALGTKLRVASYHKEYAYSLDMSQFDATLSRQLIHWAFKVLRTWFDPNEIEPVSNKTVREIFDLVEYYFVHTTIVMPDGRIYIGKDHGVPSGSYFTQMIDSVCNTIIAGAISSRFHLHVSKKEIFVLGDDMLFWSNRKMSLDVIAKYARETFAVKLHGAEKSSIYHFDEAIHYLGRDWENGLPTLCEEEIIARMVYPESFRKYSEEPDARNRQVRMMILAYASTYKAAWSIAYKLLDGSDRNIHRGCANLDVNTYCKQRVGGDGKIRPEYFSGLMRYKFKYLNQASSQDIPITATQYWL